MKSRPIASILATAFLLAASYAASAVADGDKRCKHDQDCALRAVERGEIRPFADVLALVRARVRGQIVGVELEREDGIWVYKIKILADDGRRKKMEVDARSLTVLKLKDD